MRIIKKFRKYFAKPSYMTDDDVEDASVYFTELFDNLLDLGITRQDFKFWITIADGVEIRGHIQFPRGIRKHWYAFLNSRFLKTFRMEMKSRYKYIDILDEKDFADVKDFSASPNIACEYIGGVSGSERYRDFIYFIQAGLYSFKIKFKED